MTKRNKSDMSLAAKVPPELPAQMLKEVEFETSVVFGDISLVPENAVSDDDVWN